LQKLFVLNSPFMVHHAQALADRLLAAEVAALPQCEHEDKKSDDVRRIELAYLRGYGRAPTEREIELASDYLGSGEGEAEERLQRWQQFAHVLLASNEFLFLD
jgi:hypothetical protein